MPVCICTGVQPLNSSFCNLLRGKEPRAAGVFSKRNKGLLYDIKAYYETLLRQCVEIDQMNRRKVSTIV